MKIVEIEIWTSWWIVTISTEARQMFVEVWKVELKLNYLWIIPKQLPEGKYAMAIYMY